MYAEYDQNLYCDAIRCISPNGTRLRHGTIVRADTCDAFCMCTGSRVVRFDCPASLHYNEKTERCDYPQLAQCKPEFLSEESLKLYELYNPGKLLKQGYEAENWRHLWKCMDKFNNVTRQNETQEESSAEQNGDFETAGKAVMDSIDKLTIPSKKRSRSTIRLNSNLQNLTIQNKFKMLLKWNKKILQNIELSWRHMQHL